MYTFLAIWVGADVLSMRFTFSLVATIWSFIALLVAVGVTVNRNQEISFIGPTPVSHSKYSLDLLLKFDSTGVRLTITMSDGRWRPNICGCGSHWLSPF